MINAKEFLLQYVEGNDPNKVDVLLQQSEEKTFKFREQIFQESRDMFVVVNMLNGMLNRYLGIPHVMHKSMDKAYFLIHKAIEDNEKAQRKLNEIMDEDDTT